MKLYQIFWRATGGAMGDTYCHAQTPAEAVTYFRKALREHSALASRVIVTGIAEDRGQFSVRMVNP